jgi:Na+/phosphate symporter
MIKIFSSDFEKMREQYERKKGFKKIEKDEKIGALSTTDRTACQLAKSSFYMSLDNKNYTKKIMTFSELVKIKAKQHFKASSNFFGNSVFGTSFN